MKSFKYEKHYKRILGKILIINKFAVLFVSLVLFPIDLLIRECFAGWHGLSLHAEISSTAVNQVIKKNVPQNMLFHHLNTDDGLVQNNVVTIFQDSKGFMWFGTENGLSRYDGYEFVNYEYDIENENGLYSPIILSITEDADGIIWIATAKGLNSYNPEFKRFQRHTVELSGNTGFERIYKVKSAYKKIWLGTDNGLYKLDDNQFTKVRLVSNDAININMPIYGINDDSNGNMWLITRENRLLSYVFQNGEFHEYRPEFNDSSIVINDTEFFQSELWLATSNGVYVFDWQTNRLHHI